MIRVQVPNALSGYFLAGRLGDCGAQLGGSDGDGWLVEIPTGKPHSIVLARVQEWLEEERLDGCVVDVEGTSYAMENPREQAAAPTTRAPDGAGPAAGPVPLTS